MPFKRFVQTGRVALVTDGADKGKLVSIVDIIDQTRVLIDGPATNVTRNQIRINQLQLTKFRLKFPYTASSRVVRKSWQEGKIDEKWANSAWAKKAEAKKKRAEMGDFDRFKLRNARQRRNKLRTEAFFRIKKKTARSGALYGKKKLPKGTVKPKPRKPRPTRKSKKTAAATKDAPAPAVAPKK